MRYAFVVFLIISMSIAAVHAQQQSIYSLIAEAERDANKDVKKPLWFGLGGGICILGGIDMCVAILGAFPSSSGSSWFGYAPGVPSQGKQTTLLGSLFSRISNYNPAPPQKRLLGKTPDYVQHYTRAYQKKARHHQVKWAAIGAGSCRILTISSTLIYIRLQD